jgi:Uma2 family endonuclease
MEIMASDIGPPLPGNEPDRDHLVVVRGISWAQYTAICDARERVPKLSYLDGVLELVTKSRRHEIDKKLIARLLETYALECNFALTGVGEMTLQNKEEAAAAEGDETYFVGADPVDRPPDVAIEVVLASGGIDKLEVYRRLRVREVWFWIKGHFWLYELVGGSYRKIRASRLIPDFDLDLVARILLTTRDDEDHTSIVRRYRDTLNAQP